MKLKALVKVTLYFLVLSLICGCQATNNAYHGPGFSDMASSTINNIALFTDYWSVQLDETDTHNELVLSTSKSYGEIASQIIHEEIFKRDFTIISEEYLVGFGPGHLKVLVVDDPDDLEPEIDFTPLYISNKELNKKNLNRALLSLFPKLDQIPSNLSTKEKDQEEKYGIPLLYPYEGNISLEMGVIRKYIPADYYLFFMGSGLDQRKSHRSKDFKKSASTAIVTTALTLGHVTPLMYATYSHQGKMVILDKDGEVVWVYAYSFKNGDRKTKIKKSIQAGFASQFKIK